MVILASLAGYSWLAVAMVTGAAHETGKVPLCLFHLVTGIPCPSCGSTRSILSLLHGDLTGSLYWNPIGWLLLSALILFPCWILADSITGKDSFFRFYLRAEQCLKKKWILIPAILLVAINWFWNIYKGI